jgi:hypothetical protein
VRAFSALLGYWLGDGSFNTSNDCITFHQKKNADQLFVPWVIAACGLVVDACDEGSHLWCVKEASWVKFFKKEFGWKYIGALEHTNKHDYTQSCKEIPDWTFTLPADLVRNLLAGLQLADGFSAEDANVTNKHGSLVPFERKMVNTSPHVFRDQVRIARAAITQLILPCVGRATHAARRLSCELRSRARRRCRV